MKVYQHLILVAILCVTVWNYKVSADSETEEDTPGEEDTTPGEEDDTPGEEDDTPGEENKPQNQSYWQCLKCLKTSFPGTGVGGCIKKLSTENMKVFADCCNNTIGGGSKKLGFCSRAQKGLVSALSICSKKNEFLELGKCLEERILSESHSKEDEENFKEFMKCKDKAAACLTADENGKEKPKTAGRSRGVPYSNPSGSCKRNGKLHRPKRKAGSDSKCYPTCYPVKNQNIVITGYSSLYYPYSYYNSIYYPYSYYNSFYYPYSYYNSIYYPYSYSMHYPYTYSIYYPYSYYSIYYPYSSYSIYYPYSYSIYFPYSYNSINYPYDSYYHYHCNSKDLDTSPYTSYCGTCKPSKLKSTHYYPYCRTCNPNNLKSTRYSSYCNTCNPNNLKSTSYSYCRTYNPFYDK